MNKFINRPCIEIEYVLLKAGKGYHGRWSALEIHTLLKKEKEKKEENFKKGLLKDLRYTNKNWYRTVRVKELEHGSSENYLELLIQKGFVNNPQDNQLPKERFRYQPSPLLRDHMEKVCFGSGSTIDPFTPDFKNVWQKEIIKNYIRFCYQQIEKGPKYPQYPTLEDITDFFQISTEDAEKGIKQLTTNGNIKETDMGNKTTPQQYEYVPNNEIPFNNQTDNLDCLQNILGDPKPKKPLTGATSIKTLKTPTGIKTVKTFHPPKTNQITLDTATKQYFQDLPSKIKDTSKGNQKKHKNYIQLFPYFLGKNMKTTEITEKNLKQFFENYGSVYKPSTLLAVYRSIKEFLFWLRIRKLSNLEMPLPEQLGIETTEKPTVATEVAVPPKTDNLPIKHAYNEQIYLNLHLTKSMREDLSIVTSFSGTTPKKEITSLIQRNLHTLLQDRAEIVEKDRQKLETIEALEIKIQARTKDLEEEKQKIEADRKKLEAVRTKIKAEYN